MRGIWTVARRELRGYFDQPTAYVLIVAFLGLSLFLGFRTMYASGVATMRPLFDLMPLLFAVFVPAATMRAIAEERRSNTLEWLMAQPLSEVELVVGKFFGNWAFVLIAVAATMPTALGVLMVSEADSGIVIAQYLGGCAPGRTIRRTRAVGVQHHARSDNSLHRSGRSEFRAVPDRVAGGSDRAAAVDFRGARTPSRCSVTSRMSRGALWICATCSTSCLRRVSS